MLDIGTATYGMPVPRGTSTSTPYPGEPQDGGTSKRSPRGTTNGNARGGSEQRRRRREWLIETYRANVDVLVVTGRYSALEAVTMIVDLGTEGAQHACRCYRCGVLLTVDTVTVDRIKPGCQGGTYRRDNCRPACSRCNSSTGGATRGKGKR